MRTKLLQLVVGFALSLFGALVHSQADPRTVLMGMIQQLQTGTPNPSWYSPQLWNTIAMQTGNTGLYHQLAALGPVSGVTINQKQQLPGGNLYAMTAKHHNGTSNWNLGLADSPNRIEYSNFQIGTVPTILPPAPPGEDPQKPGSGSPSCEKFPNMC